MRAEQGRPLRTLAASRRASPRGGFSMAEMLVVMAIVTVLVATLVVLVPRLRVSAMSKAALSDIQNLSMVIGEYQEDKGGFPDKAYSPADPNAPKYYDYLDKVLFYCLTEPNFDPQSPPAPPGAGQDAPTPLAGATGKGWGRARDNYEFLRGDSKIVHQFLDPWGVPYYYIPYTSYLLGVRINDPTDSTPLKDPTTGARLPNYYGTTPLANDFRTGDHNYPPDAYYSPGALLKYFYNSTTFQIHSKGPDQRTDYCDDLPDTIDACDRGCDPDDINNFGGGNVSQ